MAKSYLKKAGDPNGFSFTALTSTDLDPTSAAQATVVQSDLAQVGITMNIQNLAGDAYIQDWLKGKFQAAFAWNGADPNPYTMYGRYFGTGRQPRRARRLQLGALAEAAGRGRHGVQRWPRRQAIWTQFSNALTSNAVWIWLFTGLRLRRRRSVGPRVHVGPDELDLARLAALDHAFLARHHRRPNQRAKEGPYRRSPAGEAPFWARYHLSRGWESPRADQCRPAAAQHARHALRRGRDHLRGPPAAPGQRRDGPLGVSAGLLSHAQLVALDHYYGVGQPFFQQFGSWLGAMFTGNLGVSLSSRTSVASLIAAALPVTFELAIASMIIGELIGVLFGVFGSLKPGPRRRRRRPGRVGRRPRRAQLRHRHRPGDVPGVGVPLLPVLGGLWSASPRTPGSTCSRSSSPPSRWASASGRP